MSKNQHAYKKYRSVETILHNVVKIIEKTVLNNEYTLGIFFDIEETFDKTLISSITSSAFKHGVPTTITKYISFSSKIELLWYNSENNFKLI